MRRPGRVRDRLLWLWAVNLSRSDTPFSGFTGSVGEVHGKHEPLHEWRRASPSGLGRARELLAQSHILGLVNNTHPSATDLLHNAVVRNCFADHLGKCLALGWPHFKDVAPTVNE